MPDEYDSKKIVEWKPEKILKTHVNWWSIMKKNKGVEVMQVRSFIFASGVVVRKTVLPSPTLLRFVQPAINRNFSANSTISQEWYRKHEKGAMPYQW
ncbi:MAG: hypothetical protein MAG551_01858 [Candidatus Scalindua arabica]|uniref:Uncharacterized protein n=1 Tax=Candidatus Scalindua arabica TaxID=1127984 RepID=A0A942A1G6_9BACT|nr:hypothetical protein [Candidatus Scalindua arabica]